MIAFSPFRLDPSNEQLWRGRELVSLKPKAFALLRYLVERPQRLITKDELLEQFWSDVHVGDAVLKTHMAEIRRALGDDIKSPRFIETAHRRGYRFIAALEAASTATSETELVPAAADVAPSPLTPALSSNPPAKSADSRRSTSFVGRERELRQLEASLNRALQGPLLAVFLTGEAGAGKTTLASEFLARLERRGDLQLARGQCVEQYGASEAYLPVLEALGRLCRQAGKERILAVLRRQAPSWLAQLPGVLDAAEQASLAATASATPERMLRELAEAVLAISEERGLVLLFEDLHWADPSTLHLISYLARRSDPARVLVLGTYRQHAAREKDHPLVSIQQDLQVSGRGEEIALGQLSEQALSEYLEARFPGHRFPAQLVEALHERTNGSPLFVARLVDYWLERDWLVECAGAWQLAVELPQLLRGVPTSVARMIERELERLPEFERSLVDVASVIGVEFSVSTLAAVLEVEPAKTEEVCFAWARKGQLLRALGTSSGGEGRVSLRCAFAHGLYRQVAYERIGPARAADLHLRVGTQLELSHAGSVEAVAAELVLHFERGQAYASAVRYSMLAAQRALSRSAYRETIDYVLRGLDLLRRLPADSDRCQYELQLELMRGATLAATRGFAAPETESSYARCKELCSLLGDRVALLPVVLEGIWMFYLLRGDSRSLGAFAQQISDLAQQQADPKFLLEARTIEAVTSLHRLGFREARPRLEAVLPELDAYPLDQEPALYRQDSRLLVRGYLNWALWALGYPCRALAGADANVALAKRGGHPFSVASTLHYRAVLLMLMGRHEALLEASTELLELAGIYELPLFRAFASMCRGLGLAGMGDQGRGLVEFERGWELYSATGAGNSGSGWRCKWAEELAGAGRYHEADGLIEQAFDVARRTDDHLWDAELYRVRGEIARCRAQAQDVGGASSEEHFRHALELAQLSGARTFELRAAVSLAQLWFERGRPAQAHALLAPILAAFDEGWDTPDLREAAQLLAELSGEHSQQPLAPALSAAC